MAPARPGGRVAVAECVALFPEASDPALSRPNRPSPRPFVRIPATKARIVQFLCTRPMTAAELTRRLEVQKAAVHRHLSELAAAGLVHRRARVKWVYYDVTVEGRRWLEELPSAVPSKDAAGDLIPPPEDAVR